MEKVIDITKQENEHLKKQIEIKYKLLEICDKEIDYDQEIH